MSEGSEESEEPSASWVSGELSELSELPEGLSASELDEMPQMRQLRRARGALRAFDNGVSVSDISSNSSTGGRSRTNTTRTEPLGEPLRPISESEQTLTEPEGERISLANLDPDLN